MDAARILFATNGYAGTTIDDIVAKADVAKVTFYYYFKSKEEIALEIKRKGTEEAIAYIETLLAKQLPAEEMIRAFIYDVVEWTEENWRLLDVFCAQRFSPLLERETTTECKPEPITICLDAIILKGQEEGKFRKNIDRCRVAHLIDIAILCEQYHWVRSGRDKGTLLACLEKCFDFALNGIVERSP